jgi:hypothetical protein
MQMVLDSSLPILIELFSLGKWSLALDLAELKLHQRDISRKVCASPKMSNAKFPVLEAELRVLSLTNCPAAIQRTASRVVERDH